MKDSIIKRGIDYIEAKGIPVRHITKLVINKEERFWEKHYIKRNVFSKEKIFYIIRARDCDQRGLFSLFNTNIGHMKYAIDKGYIPVVDMKNYSNMYLKKNDIGKVNSWEDFFAQPMEIGVEEAYAGKRVILSNGDPIYPRPDACDEFFDYTQKEWRKFVHKYVKINPEILKKVDEEWNMYFQEKDRILGVLVRGTDYVQVRPKGHPIQPDKEQVLKDIQKVMLEQNCNKVFLATEDYTIFQFMKKELGSACYVNDKKFVDYKEGLLSDYVEKEKDVSLAGKEYLTTIVMLSRCNCIIAGRTSGTVGAVMLSDGYEYEKYYNLGTY